MGDNRILNQAIRTIMDQRIKDTLNQRSLNLYRDYDNYDNYDNYRDYSDYDNY